MRYMTEDGVLKLSEKIVGDLNQHSEASYPHEGCGLLVGRTEDGHRVVKEVHPARNLNQERAADRYTLDPEDFRKIDLETRKRELEILGIFHSHPDHPARPSPTDLENAWEGYSYVIVSVVRGRATNATSWRLRAGTFEPEEINGQEKPWLR